MNSFWQRLVNNVLAREIPAAMDYQLDIGALTDRGTQRVNNQDYIGHIRAQDNSAVLAIVADGMGGHQGGEVASRMAVERIMESQGDGRQNKLTAKALRHRIETVNTAIYKQAQSPEALHGMGTTLVVLAIEQGMAYYAYVGDSRLYRVRAGECRQLSEDHTVVAEMLKAGLITAEEAAHHPDRNVITRAIGTYPNVVADSPEQPLVIETGDSFLLCSDGLYELVDNAEISQILTDNTAQQACQSLIQLANSRGGHDNISAMVIKVLKRTSPAKTRQ